MLVLTQKCHPSDTEAVQFRGRPGSRKMGSFLLFRSGSHLQQILDQVRTNQVKPGGLPRFEGPMDKIPL